MSAKATALGPDILAQVVAEAVREHGGEASADSVAREVVAALTRVGAEGMHEGCTEMGNARRLVRLHAKELRYCESLGGWLVWTGKRWEVDRTGEAERRAKETTRRIFTEAASATDSAEQKKLGEWAIKSQTAQRLQAMVRLAQTEREVVAKPEDFDRNPWLFNVENGTLNLRTGLLRAHDPADLITKLSPVPYRPDAASPRFLSFLDEIMAADATLVDFLRKLFAYAMTGDTREQVLPVFHGQGANGKTTLIETARYVYGDYAVHADASAFLTRRGDGPRNDIARLKGARLVTASETTEGRHLDAALVKALTGGDTIAARHLYREFFEFRPEFVVILSTNHKPRVPGDDEAVWRRLRLVPFDVSFPPERQDRELMQKLRDEAPGILRWMVEGCLEWQRDGLPVPEAVKNATIEYRSESDAIGLFLEERCDTHDPAANVGAGELYAAYRAWCEGNGEHVYAQRRFGQLLTERGFERYTSNGTRYRGLALRNLRNLPEPSAATFSREGDTRRSYRTEVPHPSVPSVRGVA